MVPPLPSTAPYDPSSSRHGSTLCFYTPPFSASDKSTPSLPHCRPTLMKVEQQKPHHSQRKAQKGMMSWLPSPSYLFCSEAWMPMATTRTTRAPSAPRSAVATPRRWSLARSIVRTQVGVIHHCFSWHHADRAMGILAELAKKVIPEHHVDRTDLCPSAPVQVSFVYFPIW
ncbi:hypothetical protein ZWY2020_016591 [Hordeum vulgare]|nr:hypothetical protein ZWY2020_016591 [Hordeum vulgare]